MLHCPEIRKKHLRRETKAIKSEAMNRTIVNHNRYVHSHTSNEYLATVESMSIWIKKVRVFRVNARNSKQQDMRNFLVLSLIEKILNETQVEYVDKRVVVESQNG